MHVPRFALLALLALSACSPAAPAPGPAQPAAPAPGATSAPTTEARADKQTAKVVIATYPNNPTPQAGTFYPQYYAPLYDTLTWFGPGFSVVPAVAEKWSVSADGLVWTFNLRNDVKWPDGTTLTAEDVAFTLNIAFELNWPQKAQFSAMKEAKAINPTTVQFTNSAIDMAFPNNAATLRLMEKAYWDKVGGFDGFLAKPQGSGPYEIAEFKAGDQTVFRKRPGKHAFRDTPLDEITFRTVTDFTQQLNGLRTGELDLVAGAFTSDQIDQLKKAGIQVETKESTAAHINFPYTTYESKNTPLKDKRVREAINYAIDRDTIAKGVFKGFNRPAGQMGTPGSPWWDDSVPAFPFDKAKAKQLLTEAGYANGFKVTYDLQPGQVPQDLILAVQGYLKDVGIDMEIIQNDNAVFLDKYFGRVPKADLFPLVSGETNGFFQSLRNAYTCAMPNGAPGLGIYCNPEVDKMLTQAFAEPDPAKRTAIMKATNKVMRADVPQIWLVTLNQGVAYGAKVRGVNLVTPTQNNYDSVYIVK